MTESILMQLFGSAFSVLLLKGITSTSHIVAFDELTLHTPCESRVPTSRRLLRPSDPHLVYGHYKEVSKQ